MVNLGLEVEEAKEEIRDEVEDEVVEVVEENQILMDFLFFMKIPQPQ